MSDEAKFRLWRWNPRWADAAPVVVWLVVGAALQFARLAGPLAPMVLQWLTPLADLVFLVAPVLFVRLFDKGSLAGLGVSRRRLGAAAAIGAPLGLLVGWFALVRLLMQGRIPFLPPMSGLAAYAVWAVYHLAAMEFFYRGWLASTFERSYGFVAAVVVSALLFALSPLMLWGTMPAVPAAFSSIGYYWRAVFPVWFSIGLTLAGLARLLRNLAVSFAAALPWMVVNDLLEGGAAHHAGRPEAMLVGTLALAGIVAVVVWLTRSRTPRAAPLR